MDSQEKTPRLLDQVRQVMRVHHYSLHTERAYVDWIKRYVRFHHIFGVLQLNGNRFGPIGRGFLSS